MDYVHRYVPPALFTVFVASIVPVAVTRDLFVYPRAAQLVLFACGAVFLLLWAWYGFRRERTAFAVVCGSAGVLLVWPNVASLVSSVIIFTLYKLRALRVFSNKENE